MTNRKKESRRDDAKLIRRRCEADLAYFISTIHPHRMLGHVHKDLIKWWTRPEALSHQLTLLPRDHQKSALMAYRIAWEITKDPTLRVLYISSTANLAQKQLGFIKQILTNDRYRELWPEMVHAEESKRSKWTESEISVDHPLRDREAIRDPTIFTAGLTTGIVGMHCDIAALDDVVVDQTAKDEIGREKVRTQVSYLASIAGTDSKVWAVGTRYHPKDLYQDFLDMTYEVFDDDGNIIDEVPLYEVYEQKVENRGDGTGEFLWPRTFNDQNGRWYGFNAQELARKKAQYSDINKFRAQYYNNPNDLSTAAIRPEHFQYFNRDSFNQDGRYWVSPDGRRINIHAAVDFAFSTGKNADYSCIAVVGVDSTYKYYVLDIERFRTNQISEYFDRILRLFHKWKFPRLTAEVNVAQEVIVEDLKNSYIRPHGLSLVIDKTRPTSHQGNKEERLQAILQPKYENLQMYHYKGGNIQLLEEELQLAKPPHDDIKDAVATAIENLTPPSGNFLGRSRTMDKNKTHPMHAQYSNSRFGGIG